ncbi:transposase [Streptomyces inhibens]|nr:transposase [Streptomyces inhibens]UKY51892.1 transposase [Streptomyces inhibens]
MLPKIDLPDLLFEVDSWTGFLDAFVHLGDGRTRREDSKTPLVALLVSEACNIGYTPVINADDEALSPARPVHVDQHYLRADTIAAANAKLFEAQRRWRSWSTGARDCSPCSATTSRPASRTLPTNGSGARRCPGWTRAGTGAARRRA